jgi:hypothetical protein
MRRLDHIGSGPVQCTQPEVLHVSCRRYSRWYGFYVPASALVSGTMANATARFLLPAAPLLIRLSCFPLSGQASAELPPSPFLVNMLLSDSLPFYFQRCNSILRYGMSNGILSEGNRSLYGILVGSLLTSPDPVYSWPCSCPYGWVVNRISSTSASPPLPSTWSQEYFNRDRSKVCSFKIHFWRYGILFSFTRPANAAGKSLSP